MSLLIKYATRGRPAKFIQAMDNIMETIGGDDFQIIVSCDTDDVTMNNESMISKISFYRNTSVYFNSPLSKVSAINANMDKASYWDWLVNFSDDMTFVVKDWDIKMLEEIGREFGITTDFFAHFNDSFTKEKLPTMHIVGRKYYERDGFIYHNSYGSISCDAEAFFVAQMRGRYKYFPTVYFKHNHPANLGTTNDDIYVRNDKWGVSDVKNYFDRMKRYFDISNPVMIPKQLQKEINELK